MIEVDEELIEQLANDVWGFADKFPAGKDRWNLKRISGCLHDIRRGTDTRWYEDMRKDF